MKLHYDVTGSGSPIVLTTGLGDSCEVWSRLFDLLRERSRVLKWDLRGHGRSEHTDNPADYTAELAVEDLRQMIAIAGATSANPAILVGHSLGGYLSLRVAVKHPEMVKALVLVSTGPGFRDEVSRGKWNEYVRSMDLGSSVSAHARLLGLQSDASVIANLTSIQCPTLVVIGGEDRRFLGAKDYLVAKIPHATAAIVEGGRHAIHVSSSAEVNRAIGDFLESAAGSRSRPPRRTIRT
jgi:pimeloyl-ACP methyl ester carboxylesterase